MPKVAEFEEKTYEKYFGHELARLCNFTFSPGQCLESEVGFDEAFMLSRGGFFWRFLHPLRPWALGMPGVQWSDLDRFAGEFSRGMPPTKFNLFVQYKRPHYIRGHNAREWSDWRCSYYRYQINPTQQTTLERLHRACASRAAVVYASPALWKRTELFAAAEKRQIVAKSNTACVERLTGHSRYTYVAPGGRGRAYSEPEDIESPEIGKVIGAGLDQEGLPFNQHIKKVASSIKRAIADEEEDEKLLNVARKAIIGEDKEAGDPAPTSFSDALLTIIAFSDAFDVSYYALG